MFRFWRKRSQRRESNAPSRRESEISTTSSQSQGKYPKCVFFIICTEFCERFSFYGMRAILTIYLTQELLYSDNSATMLFHAFAMTCYFTPVFGAVIADSYLGKFKTIFYISLIYAVGNIMISVGAIPQAYSTMNVLSLVGLLLIAIGTGGIKPCVSAFGGDQFDQDQELYLQQFFSLFYMSINIGSTVSTFVTPLLRDDIHCFGETTCFSIAFGVPAILMIAAVVTFVGGKSMYKIRAPKGNVIVDVVQCSAHAIYRRFTTEKRKGKSWLDYADDKYEPRFIKGVKILYHVLFLYLPLPLFWSLFDQQGSKWTLQATKMDGRFYGYVIKPDQMQVFNPLLAILLIPVFVYAIYPLCEKCRLFVKPLQRMVVGGLLASSAFILTGIIQLQIEKSLPVLPPQGYSNVIVINNSPCKVKIGDLRNQSLDPFEYVVLTNISRSQPYLQDVIPSECSGINEVKNSLQYDFGSNYSVQSVMVTVVNDSLQLTKSSDCFEKLETGHSKIRIFYSVPPSEKNTSISFGLKTSERMHVYHVPNTTYFGITDYEEVEQGNNDFLLRYENETGGSFVTTVGKVYLQPGGTYIVGVYVNPLNHTNITLNLYTVVEHNTVHILYQVPQYLVITFGEIMFSITGLEFSYSQAPKSLKSVLQAAWLFTVGLGDLIVIVVVAEAKFFKNQSTEFFFFALIMALDMFVFCIMSVFYKYVSVKDDDEEIVPLKKSARDRS